MAQPFALIVEDDVDLAEIFRQALTAAQFQAEVIHDGLLAQERLKQVAPVVVILDLYLPHVSGETLFRQIRSSPHLQAVRVVVTTADAVAADFLRSEADIVMVKPISYLQLRDITKRFHPASTQTL